MQDYFMRGDFLLKYRGKITDKEQDLEYDSYVSEFRHRNKRSSSTSPLFCHLQKMNLNGLAF